METSRQAYPTTKQCHPFDKDVQLPSPIDSLDLKLGFDSAQTQRQLQLSLEAHGRYIASLMEQEGMAPRDEAGGPTSVSAAAVGPMAHLQYFGGGSLAGPSGGGGGAGEEPPPGGGGSGGVGGGSGGGSVLERPMDFDASSLGPPDLDGIGLLDDMLARRSSGFNIPQVRGSYP